MTRYLVLIYGDEQRWADASEEWNDENGRRHRAFLEKVGAAVVTGGELLPSVRAVSIRGDEAADAFGHGPFVQAEHGIGGFYLIEAEDIDHAVTLARQIPEAASPHSGVEIRQMA